VIAFAAAVAALSADQWRIPRTADRRPDLQGIWDYATVTPLERSKDFSERAFFTEAEAREFERSAADREYTDLPEIERKLNADLVGDLETTARGRIDPSRRTSIVIDPPDGKLPPLTPKGQAARDSRRAARKVPPDGPEVMRISERCLPDAAGPPLLPTSYNNYVQIVQTPRNVLISTEMVHEARVIPLDGRPHLPPHIREWNGDSRGRWDGDTLVVETTNFAHHAPDSSNTDVLQVIERFTRVGERSLLYEFSVDDPATFTKRWSGAFTMHKTDEPMYEFACHEANYSMAGMLRGARAQEQQQPPK
jgi:hypothetical protein